MDDRFFKKLNLAEEAAFRRWARDNWKPNTNPDSIWHPVVRNEWNLITKTNNGEQHEG